MTFVGPTRPHRKSGGWGTRRLVALTTVPNTQWPLSLFPVNPSSSLSCRECANAGGRAPGGKGYRRFGSSAMRGVTKGETRIQVRDMRQTRH